MPGVRSNSAALNEKAAAAHEVNLRLFIRRLGSAFVLASACTLLSVAQQPSTSSAHPGARSIMDAHNCYPYDEWWHDRIDRALAAGTPVAIEQDLGWFTDPKSGRSWSVVTHGNSMSGHEPTMEHYFF